jgi:hypothetical protein
MAQVFMGRAEGFMAPLTFEGDIQRLAAVRSGGALSKTRRPDGELVSFSPPVPFRAEQVLFSAESVRAIAKTHEAETATKLAQSLAQAQALRAGQDSDSAAPRPIKVQAVSRISVSEVKRLIREALPPEPAMEVWEAPDGTMELRPEPDGCFSRAWLDHEFEEACKKGQITPRHQFLPTRTDYRGGDENDPLWLVEHEAFVWFAGLYGLPVEVDHAGPVQREQPDTTETEATEPEQGDLKPVPRFKAQEQAVLTQIAAMGLNALALPRKPAGEPGVKAEVRRALKAHPLFVGAKIFDKAWERLRASGEIADSSSPALG